MADPQQLPPPVPGPLTPGPVTPESLRLIIDCTQTVIYRRGQRFLVRVLAMISAGFGVAVLAGGRTRFEATPTFAYASTLPGSFRTWAVAALAAGGFTYAASFRWHRRGVMWGLLAMCVIFTFFTVSIFVSATQDPLTPYTGVVIYGGFSVICAVAYVVGHELRRVHDE